LTIVDFLQNKQKVFSALTAKHFRQSQYFKLLRNMFKTLEKEERRFYLGIHNSEE